jgi:hypothetical protein
MSTIDNPNIRGLGCNFHSNAVWQPYSNLLTPPNMPNYGLVSEVCWPVSIQEVANKVEVLIYPNPANHDLTIESSLLNQSSASFLIYDVLGNQIQSDALTSHQGSQTISVARLPAGLYVYKLVGANGSSYMGKFIKD